MKLTYSDTRCLVFVEITPLSSDSIPTGPVQVPMPPWYFSNLPGLDPNTFSASSSQTVPPPPAPPPPPPPPAPPVRGEGGDQPPLAPTHGAEPMPPDSPPDNQQAGPNPQVDPNWTVADQLWEQFFPGVNVSGQSIQPGSLTYMAAVPEEHQIQEHESTVRPSSSTPPVIKVTRAAVASPPLPPVSPIDEPRKEWEAVMGNKRVLQGQSKLQICVAHSHDNQEARPVPAGLQDQPVDAALKRQSHVAKRTSQYAEDKVLQAPIVDRPEYIPRDSPPSSPLTRISAGVASMVANPDPDLTASGSARDQGLSTKHSLPVTPLDVAQAVRRIRPRDPRYPSGSTDTIDDVKPTSRIRRLSRDIANALMPGKKKRKNKKKDQFRAHNYNIQDWQPAGPQRRFLDVVKIGQEARLARQSGIQQRDGPQCLESAQPAEWPNYNLQSSAAWPVTVPMAMPTAADRDSQYSLVPRRVTPLMHPASHAVTHGANGSHCAPQQPVAQGSPEPSRPSQTPIPNCPWGICSACLPRDSSLL